MADQKIAYGSSGQSITVTAASLASGSMRESTAISNTTNLFIDELVGGKITTGTSPTVDTAIKFYAYGSTDGGTTYTGEATGSDAAYTGSYRNLRFLGSVIVSATSDVTYEYGPFSMADAFGSLPSSWGIVIRNETGVDLNATSGNHAMTHQGVFGTVT